MPSRLEQLQQMLLQEPNDEFLQYAIAIEYFSINNFEKALACLSVILNKNPDYLAAYYQAGKCYEELKRFENAKTIYTKGIELDNTNPVFYDNRALSKTEKEDYAGALEDYSSSIELYPNDPETYYQRGLVKVSMNNKYDACLDFKTAEDLGSTEVKAVIKKNCK